MVSIVFIGKWFLKGFADVGTVVDFRFLIPGAVEKPYGDDDVRVNGRFKPPARTSVAHGELKNW